MATPLLSVMCAFAEFERTLILERQREGIAAAKQRGAYTGRRPALTADQTRRLRERAAAGERKSVLASEFEISRETLYSYLRAKAVTSSGASVPQPALSVTRAFRPILAYPAHVVVINAVLNEAVVPDRPQKRALQGNECLDPGRHSAWQCRPGRGDSWSVDAPRCCGSA